MNHLRRGDPRGGVRAAAAVAVLALVLAACGGSPGDGNDENRLVVAQSSDVLTLDPSVDTSPISLNVFKNICDQLTDITSEGDVAPQLAESWEASDDATVWTFTLRPDVTFHDGEPLTADDVVWTFEKIMNDDSSPVHSYLSEVEQVEKVSDTQVRFHLTTPFAPFDRQVSLISVLPQHAYEELGPDEFAKNPIGSGAFEFVSWQRDVELVIAANPDYWGGKPAIDEVVFKPVPSANSREAGLISEELDIVPLLPPSSVERLSSEPGITVDTVGSNRVLYLGFNVTKPPVDDRLLRQAIDHAIDRETITEHLLNGLGEPIGQMVAPVTFGHDPSLGPVEYDPELSRTLLAQSDYDGEPVVFQYPNNRYAFGEEVAEAVAGHLSEVGINVDMQGMEYSAFFPLWTGDTLEGIHLFAYGPSIMDADLPLGSLYESESRGYWTSERVDQLIAEQRATADAEQRAAVIAEIWQESREQVPYSFLYNEIQAYGIREGVQWEPRPDERLLFHDASLGSTG